MLLSSGVSNPPGETLHSFFFAAQEGGETIFPKHRSCQEFGFTGRLGDSWRMLGPYIRPYRGIGEGRCWFLSITRKCCVETYNVNSWKEVGQQTREGEVTSGDPKHMMMRVHRIFYPGSVFFWTDLHRWLDSWDSSRYNHTGGDGTWNIIDYHQKEIDSKTCNCIIFYLLQDTLNYCNNHSLPSSAFRKSMWIGYDLLSSDSPLPGWWFRFVLQSSGGQSDVDVFDEICHWFFQAFFLSKSRLNMDSLCWLFTMVGP